MENLKKTAEAAGIDIGKDLVRIYQWFTSPYPTMEEFAEGNTWPRISITPYLDTRNEFIFEPRPASTGMGIRDDGLLVKDTILEVDMIGMDPEVIPGPSEGTAVPEGTPSPLAGYSPAIQRGDWVFLAGEIPVDWVGDWGRAEYYGTPSGVALKPGATRTSGTTRTSSARPTTCLRSRRRSPRPPAPRSIGQSRRRSTSGTRPSSRRWTGCGAAGSRRTRRLGW